MKEKQVFNNAKWIILCKILQSLLQLVIGMISARYLGPSNYGLINYAASIVAFAMPIMKLGFDATLVYELVNSPEKGGEIVGTSLFMNVLSSLACMGGVFTFVSLTNFGQTEVILVCLLYSFSLFFGAIEMIQYWFQYKLMSKHSSLTMLFSYFGVSIYKIFLLITQKNVLWFAVSHAVEFGLIGIILLILYKRNNGAKFSVSTSRMKSMLSRSKHYILASLMLVIIQNTDHIMLTAIVGSSETGFYSAAITCVTMLQFVYIAIVDSFRPYILEEKKISNQSYEKSLMRVNSITLYLSIAQCIVFFVLADFIVLVLYGKDYAASAQVIRVLSFYFIFSLMGLLRNVWILAENKQKYLFVINLSGALLNILLNSFMIPLFGASGAAAASFITQFFANFVLGFIIKPLRRNNYLIVKSLNPVFFFAEVKNIVNIILKKEQKTSV